MKCEHCGSTAWECDVCAATVETEPFKKMYHELRADVVQVIDAEIGDDAVVMRQMLNAAIDKVEG